MTTLVVGASGATGKQLVKQLLASGQKIKVIVRPSGNIPESWNTDNNIAVIRMDINQISTAAMADLLTGCQAVASCLGHTMSWKGIYGKPRRLVTEAVSSICTAVIHNAAQHSTKVVLMNTAGNSNRDLHEPVPIAQKALIGLLRTLLPPHIDNEKAADYLRVNIGQHNPYIEWAVVRPDNLIDRESVTEYSLYPSPVQSAIFSPGKTSRINVAHCMAGLITDELLWKKWKGQMPVIYNK